jgi:hypothetical protein
MISKTESEQSDAPWTSEEVDNLNAYQRESMFHPFTSLKGTELIATKDGWVEHEGGPVVQTWAHKWMADGTWRKWAGPLG